MINIFQALSLYDTGTLFDFAVVVLSINMERLDNRCTLLVSDDSISRHECARILLYKLKSKDFEKLQEIQACDIVRFNSVFTSKLYTKSASTTDISEKISNVICDISHSRQYDQHSLTFNKLGTCTALTGGSVLVEPNIPPQMQLSRDRIFMIGCHFLEHNRRQFVNYTDKLLRDDRRIREVRVLGILSNVVVKVTQLGIVEELNSKPNRYFTRMILSDAMGIQDDEDSIPFYIESNHPILEDLRKSFRHQSCIMIHNVLTEKRESDRWTSIHGFFLVPTQNTSVSEYMKNTKRARFDFDQSHILIKSSLSFPYSNSFNASLSDNQTILIGYISLIKIIGSDIVLGDDDPWPDPMSLYNNLVEGTIFQPAIITLAIPESISSAKVYASEKIMNILCGSFDSRLSEKSSNIEMISKLIHGFISFKIPLQWTLGEQIAEVQNIPVVEEVDLLSMDF